MNSNPKHRWGPWRLVGMKLVCDLPGRPHVYEIALVTCTDSAHVLDWIAQVASRTWVDAEVLANLVLALDNILMLQASICGSGEDHRLTERRLLDLVNGYRQLTQYPGRGDD